MLELDPERARAEIRHLIGWAIWLIWILPNESDKQVSKQTNEKSFIFVSVEKIWGTKHIRTVFLNMLIIWSTQGMGTRGELYACASVHNYIYLIYIIWFRPTNRLRWPNQNFSHGKVVIYVIFLELWANWSHYWIRRGSQFYFELLNLIRFVLVHHSVFTCAFPELAILNSLSYFEKIKCNIS